MIVIEIVIVIEATIHGLNKLSKSLECGECHSK